MVPMRSMDRLWVKSFCETASARKKKKKKKGQKRSVITAEIVKRDQISPQVSPTISTRKWLANLNTKQTFLQ